MEFKGKKVLVFGAGKSGAAAAKLLTDLGADTIIYDGNEKTDRDAVKAETGGKAEVIIGNLDDSVTGTLDLVVMSPGVPCDIPLVKKFYEKGIPVWGEIELAWRAGKGRVLAVTGTNGKTTTVTLLGEIMKAFYPEVYVVGNIGIPYTGVAERQTDKAWTVAEVSSFQLETTDRFRPFGCAITNITEDHLNRHHTMEEYIRCKERIAENQTGDDVCVLNYEDKVLRGFGDRVRSRVIWFSSRRVLEKGFYYSNGIIWMNDGSGPVEVVKVSDMQLLGLHNYENVMTAAALAYSAGVPLDVIRKTVCSFRGVAHRIEFVAEIDGVRYYNDSKGTNPDAAIKGIQAMDRPTCLIGGGFDKELEFDSWIKSFDGKVKFFALIGQTREKIAETAVRLGFPKENIHFYDSLKDAVSGCAEHAGRGDAVLLSPACASWGQFDNYEQRGDMFKKYVHEMES